MSTAPEHQLAPKRSTGLLNRVQASVRAMSGQSSVQSKGSSAADIFRTVSVSEDQVDVLRKVEQTSKNEAECAICYAHLCKGRVAVLRDAQGERSCRHFFHASCLEKLAQSGVQCICPLCRTPFTESLPVPSPEEDPEAWFKAADASRRGKLTRQEVTEALRAVLPVDGDALERHFDFLWASWDKTGSGDISLDEFLSPDGGLLSWVVATTKEVQKRGEYPPDVALDREGWFRYWDTTRSGNLDREEVMRALLKTFREADVIQLRAVVGALWEDFAGPDTTSVSFEDFTRPGAGFLDMVMANMGVEEERVPPPPEPGHRTSAAGSVCSCGKIHIHRGDRVQRGPGWASGDEDGGVGQIGTVVRDEESSESVFVHWDLSLSNQVHHYSWPSDPTCHQVMHTHFEDIAPDVLLVKLRTGLSSAASVELLRRTVAARGLGDDLVAAALQAFEGSRAERHALDESNLRTPLKLFDRCHVLPEKELVKQWFDACSPCPCPNPDCTGRVRWNPRAEKHLGREGYVLKIDERDDTVFVEVVGRCSCKVWYPRLAVDPVLDLDTAEEPRFQVGTRVECNIDNGWALGTIKRIWWRQEGWGNRSTAPYQIKLDDGRMIFCPRDQDETVRRVASG